jgi:hypothetical protein
MLTIWRGRWEKSWYNRSLSEEKTMSEQAKNIPWFDARLFRENQNKYPPEEFLKYAGKVIAWSLDGTCVLESGADEGDVADKLRKRGLDPSLVIFANGPDEESSIGFVG